MSNKEAVNCLQRALNHMKYSGNVELYAILSDVLQKFYSAIPKRQTTLDTSFRNDAWFFYE